MRFSFAWLSQYLDLPDSPREVGERLTSIGFAVEAIEGAGGDTVLDLEVNPNRVDCMNHLGIARELAAAYDTPFRSPVVDLAPAAVGSKPTVTVAREDDVDCRRYVALVVRGVTVGPSPGWLAERLHAVGVRPINNIVDITNFVLWETGQPLHAFDLQRVRDSSLSIRRALHGEHLVTLDGVGRELDPDILVIADGGGAIALAGIMGGASTEVSGSTCDVLIESAHFAPSTVRRGARKLGMHTDASHRFERGSDPEACLQAARRAASLMCEIAGGETAGDEVDERSVDRELAGDLDLRELERFAGARIERQLIERVFPALGFRLEPKREDSWRVTVPSWRLFDVEANGEGEVYPAHFYEEALRFHGYERVASSLPEVGGPDAGSSAAHERRERIRGLLSASGLAETVTYGFYDQASDERFAGPVGSDGPLRLTNALSEQYSLMRRSLLPNLVAGAEYNFNRGLEAVRLFEIGHVFPGPEAEELEVVGLIMGGELGTPWTRRRELDLFDLKGVVEELGLRCGLRFGFTPASVTGLLAGTASQILVEGEGRPVGLIGEVADPGSQVRLCAAELRTSVLASDESPIARVPSRYPGVTVDLTLTHRLDVHWTVIAGAIEARRPRDLVSFDLKDRYTGEGVPEGFVNTTISFFYNSSERSLTSDEVNERHEQLAASLQSEMTKET